jgi:hypothetical protein
MEELKTYFKDRGILELPAAILVHEIIGISWLTGMWAICYKL